MLKVAGASQLLMLAAAAAQAPAVPAQQRQARASSSLDSPLAGQQEQQQLQATKAAAQAAAGKHAKVLEQLLKAIALLPDKVRLLQPEEVHGLHSKVLYICGMGNICYKLSSNGCACVEHPYACIASCC
jgi:hypothetical protein